MNGLQCREVRNVSVITKEADQMTDFQFRALMAMVLDMLNKVKSLEELEETKRTIEQLTKGITDLQSGKEE